MARRIVIRYFVEAVGTPFSRGFLFLVPTENEIESLLELLLHLAGFIYSNLMNELRVVKVLGLTRLKLHLLLLLHTERAITNGQPTGSKTGGNVGVWVYPVYPNLQKMMSYTKFQ
jgi:hypothetical protein